MRKRITICLIFGLVVFSAGTVWGYTEGTLNNFFGAAAGSNTTSDYNSFFGGVAGASNTTGGRNNFFGSSSGLLNTTGNQNNFFGTSAGYNTTTGNYNNFFGDSAGFYNTTGQTNSFFGNSTGKNNTTGSWNTFFGQIAGLNNTTGYYNTFLGVGAGYYNSTGHQNVFLGYLAGYYETGSSKLYISNSDTDYPLIYGEFDNQYLEVNGDLGVTGKITIDNIYQTQSNVPGFWLDEMDGAVQKGAYFVLDGGVMQVQRRKTSFGGWEASPLEISVSAPHRSFYLRDNGYIGFGKYPGYPIDLAGGAFSDGFSWQDASSRELKDDINDLSISTAIETLENLTPVTFKYKKDLEKTEVGFIAEDVPELVATKDRKGLSSMDIVAVLTKVVQELQKTVQEQQAKIGQLETALQFKQDKNADLAQVDISQVPVK